MKSIHILPALLLILPLILIMAAPGSIGTSPNMQPANSPSGGLQFVGTVLPNGDVAILYYTAPVGTTIIHRDTVVPLDQISLEIYSPNSGTLAVMGEQFQKFVSENITIPSGNKSYTTQISVPYNPDKFNATIQTQTRSFQVIQILLPQTSTQQYVELTLDNTTIQFQHRTSPDLIPVIFSGLGDLGIALGYTLTGVLIFFAGTLTASFVLKKIKYWPPFGKTGWFIILLFLTISMGILIASAYYQLAYLAWYDWLFPFYIFASLAMLELWPQTWQKLFLVIVGGSGNEKDGDEKDWDVVFPRVSRNESDGSWEYLRNGRREALKRILFHIPISFSGSRAKPEGILLQPNEENLSNLYFLKDFPELRRSIPAERKHFRRKTGRPVEYKISLNAHSQKEVGQFVSELKAVGEFADENETLRKENRNYRIRLENGKVRYNNEEINEITRKIYGASMEYHKGQPESAEDKDPKEDKDVGKEK